MTKEQTQYLLYIFFLYLYIAQFGRLKSSTVFTSNCLHWVPGGYGYGGQTISVGGFPILGCLRFASIRPLVSLKGVCSFSILLYLDPPPPPPPHHHPAPWPTSP